jgi:hypothetical protein
LIFTLKTASTGAAAGVVGFALALALLFPRAAWSAGAADPQSVQPTSIRAGTDAPSTSERVLEPRPAAPAAAHTVRMPLVLLPDRLMYRLGFGGTSAPVNAYGEVASLRTGWYLDWAVQRAPARPYGMEYAQMVRVHQKLTCPLFSANAHDRSRCPYAQPLDYVVMPSLETIREAARANPGSLWLIGNEMDRRDWPGGGQDEMLPETYAVAYHDLHTFIKAVDPSARLAIGGVIQPTPLRLEYLSKIWATYQARYHTDMPVDVWNVHNFIMKEYLNGDGASIPPGSTADRGVVYPAEVGGDGTHVSMAIFDQQIRAFRAWMRDRGQQQKPLIVSEYGVLYHHIPEADTPEEVRSFMLATFDYFLNTRDCSLGYGADDCRLVQRWIWYSLDDSGMYSGFNPYAALFDPITKKITNSGMAFRDWSLANMHRAGLGAR